MKGFLCLYRPVVLRAKKKAHPEGRPSLSYLAMTLLIAFAPAAVLAGVAAPFKD